MGQTIALDTTCTFTNHIEELSGDVTEEPDLAGSRRAPKLELGGVWMGLAKRKEGAAWGLPAGTL